jgi:hypothetical protein
MWIEPELVSRALITAKQLKNGDCIAKKGVCRKIAANALSY